MTVSPPSWWPTEATSCFEDLAAYRLVGASACADRISAALVDVADRSQQMRREVPEDLAVAGRLFCGLKPDTALYRNLASLLVEAAQGGRAGDVQTVARKLSDYRRAAQARVINLTQALLQEADTLLVHDYSSMVLRIVQGLGTQRPRRIVVTAGEPLGQGARVARLVAAAGHEVTYTPDMSVARVPHEIDAFITGVESFYLDGSLANTVGTAMLALLCREMGVPVIAPAETLKCDAERESVADAPLTARLLHPWPANLLGRNEGWSIVTFVLDAVSASLISTYVTEAGACAPTDVGAIARQACHPGPPSA